jgi:hypothetical protein
MDSRALQDGDVILVALLRPGTYRLLNVRTGQEGKMKVDYPERGKMALTKLELTPVEVGERVFRSRRWRFALARAGSAVQCAIPATR